MCEVLEVSRHRNYLQTGFSACLLDATGTLTSDQAIGNFEAGNENFEAKHARSALERSAGLHHCCS